MALTLQKKTEKGSRSLERVVNFSEMFNRVAKATAHLAGHPVTTGLAVLIIVIWAVTGPIFGFSDTWQLVINTGTTIITFLMVFLIQNTQNRDSVAVQLKLDELIRTLEGAKNNLIDIEEATEDDLNQLREGYRNLANEARQEQPDNESKPQGGKIH